MNFNGKFGPLLIAEIGGNHEGDFAQARRLTELAIESNADAIKFQIYEGDELVSSLESPDRNKHFKKFELTVEQHLELANTVKKAGRLYIASVWDLKNLAWIDPYISIYKIGSGDLTAYPILREIAKRNKPMILSAGLADEMEVLDTIRFIQNVNPFYTQKDNLAVLQCTTMYPIAESDANLNVMETMKQKTGLTVGFSNHLEDSYGIEVAVAAGAEIIEFHFTDTRIGKVFRDHKLSYTKDEVYKLIEKLTRISTLKGSFVKTPLPIEIENNNEVSFRRAVYPSRDILKGEILTSENLTVLRPNHGIDAREFDKVLGKRSKVTLAKHQMLNWDLIE